MGLEQKKEPGGSGEMGTLQGDGLELGKVDECKVGDVGAHWAVMGPLVSGVRAVLDEADGTQVKHAREAVGALNWRNTSVPLPLILFGLISKVLPQRTLQKACCPFYINIINIIHHT